MTVSEIRRFYSAAPFEPFRIHMAGGRSVDVPHPEFMLLSRNGRRLIVDLPQDTWEVIDVSHVTSLETLAKNGTRSRKRRKR